MRNHGTRFELVRMQPHDHIGWVFAGRDQFAALAGPFLAEGVALGQRLMYVAEDPEPEQLAGLVDVVDPDLLQVASIAEVYGASGLVDAPRQRAVFGEALAQALTEGYRGIRVAADNTPLVSDAERFAAWLRWEITADRFMAEKPVTGLCAFDRERVDVDRLRHLATLHPLFSAASFTPQFRLFADGNALCVEGEMDCFAVDQLWLALEHLPSKIEVVIDLAKTTFLSHRVLSGLGRLADANVDVTICGGPVPIREFRAVVESPKEHLHFVDTWPNNDILPGI
jgi:hypothetical protein